MEVLMGLVNTMLIEVAIMDNFNLRRTEICLQAKMVLHTLQLKFIKTGTINKVREVLSRLVLLSTIMQIHQV